ncbi:MAG: hypothetical protein ACHQT9_03450 [Candidatus Saccharimonadales bacterium]
MSRQYTVDRTRWAKLGIFDQMGNIYSEVGRSFKANDKKSQDQAIARATDLFNATIYTLGKAESPRAKEVRRAKQQYLEIVSNKNASQESIQSLDRYFLQFAIAARLHR